MTKKYPTFVSSTMSDDEIDFIVEKLNEKSSIGKPYTFAVIASMAVKKGYKEITLNKVSTFSRKYEGTLKEMGIVLGRDRNMEASKNRTSFRKY